MAYADYDFYTESYYAMSCQKLTLIVWQPEPAILLIH